LSSGYHSYGINCCLCSCFAAKPQGDIEFANKPQSAELFEDIDLGEFGNVPVLDLVQYYIENPPINEVESGTEKKTRFQGC